MHEIFEKDTILRESAGLCLFSGSKANFSAIYHELKLLGKQEELVNLIDLDDDFISEIKMKD